MNVLDTYRIGNAQSIGACQVQSNYFSTYVRNDCSSAIAVLADGTIDHVNGRKCAVLAVEDCMREFLCMPQGTNPLDFFDSAAGKILQDMRDTIYLGKAPRLSLCILFITGRQLSYYNIGDCRAFLFDGQTCRPLEGRSGGMFFGKGMAAGVISNGVWDALNEMEIIAYLRKKGHPYTKAQQMLMGVKKKRKKAARNATIVLVEGRV